MSEVFTLRNGATVYCCKPDRLNINYEFSGYIVLARTNSSFCNHPYATWIVDLDGNSYHGHYFEAYGEAFKDWEKRGYYR